MARDTDFARRESQGLMRPQTVSSPFRMLDHFADEMDRLFDGFGLGRGWGVPRFGQSSMATARQGDLAWNPEVEAFHRNNELIVRVDLPGLSKDDINVDVTEDRIVVQGERKQQREEEREGIYRSERVYGAFHREIPLPPGTMADQAKAGFKDGVLEIRLPAAPESTRRGRRLEIADGPASKK
jgi:HSP20 family protein